MDASTSNPQPPDAAVLYGRVRDITRSLHDALRELGHDKRIEASLGQVPDAKARLSFIARVTGDAAEKVLNTVDAAQARQLALGERAAAEEARLLAAGAAPEALAFVQEVKASANDAGAQLTEIMMAQDFHDLTGQTVRKVVDIASTVEDALLQLLLETSVVPLPRVALDGPVTDTSRTDVVANQAQVDDLLASLGF
ncbi:protein phosphatase CheZ [Ramlibacter sp. G-1-2-2]|uniref:Protein phosphatase CheZ n=1 Tax=Ramlibacter agri TaxID=2728837 RepID=A0A848H468_9BURK|nr:protein phosphatase CheZ [Ramlibacter agri]NML43423.1 protein phosphatase CheZ [Ramlibacter agri]